MHAIDTTATKEIVHPDEQLTSCCNSDQFTLDGKKYICQNPECSNKEKETTLVNKPDATIWTIGVIGSIESGRLISETAKVFNFMKGVVGTSPDEVVRMWIELGLKNFKNFMGMQNGKPEELKFETQVKEILTFGKKSVITTELISKIPYGYQQWLAFEIQQYSKDSKKN